MGNVILVWVALFFEGKGETNRRREGITVLKKKEGCNKNKKEGEGRTRATKGGGETTTKRGRKASKGREQ